MLPAVAPLPALRLWIEYSSSGIRIVSFSDVTQLERAANTELVIAVWAQDISRDGGQFMGQLSIPMSAVYHQKPVDSVRVAPTDRVLECSSAH